MHFLKFYGPSQKYFLLSKIGNRYNNYFQKLFCIFRNIVREPKYAFHDDDCTLITDAEGNIPQTRWVAHVRKYVNLEYTYFISTLLSSLKNFKIVNLPNYNIYSCLPYMNQIHLRNPFS